eukprot:TRINITY_DN13449_c0_g2_i3.p1 TRINITY_DN13449_c0_g2~~TRINITY_DN13449_c0_g2_i3.p1  ORF type:complete len:368 (+),score=55.88 TRINITY_DN13449_c0_g2_i3:61-1104(+)
MCIRDRDYESLCNSPFREYLHSRNVNLNERRIVVENSMQSEWNGEESAIPRRDLNNNDVLSGSEILSRDFRGHCLFAFNQSLPEMSFNWESSRMHEEALRNMNMSFVAMNRASGGDSNIAAAAMNLSNLMLSNLILSERGRSFPNFQESNNIAFPPMSMYYRRAAKTKNLTKKNLVPNEPHLKLTVIKCSTDVTNPPEYVVTPRGMIGSHRNTDHDDLTIGRQHETVEGIIPNDIILSTEDRAISRIHCRLIYKYGFKIPRPIPDAFVAFLMMTHPRLGEKSPGKKLPAHLLRLIYSFFKDPLRFYIVDVGSAYGTYVKLSQTPSQQIQKGNMFLIGADTHLSLIHI